MSQHPTAEQIISVSYNDLMPEIMPFTCSQTLWSGLRSSFTKWGTAPAFTTACKTTMSASRWRAWSLVQKFYKSVFSGTPCSNILSHLLSFFHTQATSSHVISRPYNYLPTPWPPQFGILEDSKIFLALCVSLVSHNSTALRDWTSLHLLPSIYIWFNWWGDFLSCVFLENWTQNARNILSYVWDCIQLASIQGTFFLRPSSKVVLSRSPRSRSFRCRSHNRKCTRWPPKPDVTCIPV